MRRFFILSLIGIGAVVVASGLGLVFSEQDSRTSGLGYRALDNRTLEQGIIQAVLETPSLSYQVSVPQDSTAYDLMVLAASQHNDFSFKGREFPGLGFFVEEINGLSQDQKEGRYWIYYVNGEVAPVGISQYKVKNNDVLTWKYEDF